MMLSTSDNPYNPYKDFSSWYDWDVEHGYNTCAFLDRVATHMRPDHASHDHAFLNSVIESIVKHNVLGVYISVERPEDIDNDVDES